MRRFAGAAGAAVLALVLAAAVLLASGSDGTGAGSGLRLPGRRVTTTTIPPLAPPPAYTPLAGEPVPEVKQGAADVLQTIATYERGQGTVEAARARLAARNLPVTLADAAVALYVPTVASAGDIVYPQLGGLTTTDASVMVVLRQRFQEEGGQRSQVVRTIDVRLRRASGVWTVTALPSLGGEPVAVPATISEDARRVLEDPRLDLPDTARWDIARGKVAPRVLAVLLEISARHSASVTVFATGHPVNVFNRRSLSNHARGRAVDIWAIDGQPVLEQRDPAGPLGTLVKELVAAGVTELGAPFAAGGSFTDTVHQDHLHLGFDA